MHKNKGHHVNSIISDEAEDASSAIFKEMLDPAIVEVMREPKLPPIKSNGKIFVDEDETECPYCGCSCQYDDD